MTSSSTKAAYENFFIMCFFFVREGVCLFEEGDIVPVYKILRDIVDIKNKIFKIKYTTTIYTA